MTDFRGARRTRRNPSVTDDAIDKIQKLIISGSWGPGDRLPKETELAAQLGLSRNSLREAVRALSQLRVLEVRQGDGTYVTSLEPELLLESTGFVSHLLVGESAVELFEVRRLLEGAAAALAAARTDAAGKEALRATLERMIEAETVEALVEADVDFHAVMARATGNTFLTSLDVTRDEHRRIYEAIVAGDPELARAAAMAHIASGERWLRAQLASADTESSVAPAEVGR